ncbi:hypothetical protein AUJ77_02070 [Candidatus Nomurabacteria bacterium CG1_02_43_90]|uniref:Uncharacterized protein n=1 Tax=Candidatus Nomurabacteria bacterium CG1_02_43_90 TaxID=1805281 RepID=A0A1J4V3M7_9BACT|nr:MAG: hypothetical protein AUJ77_02070 [Candidatus Nomurabacteria bacterium CG1_02_43_90]
MLKALLDGRGTIAVVATNGVVSAVCGCGGRNAKDYDFVAEVADEQSFTAPQSSCDCGGTREKMHENMDAGGKETHHAKPVLRKHHRETVRRMTV